MTEINKLTKFEQLLQLNVNDKIETKKTGGATLSYLSWTYAVIEMEKAYPDWEYNILEFNGLPYQFDANTGYMVQTEIKAGGKTKKMWLPVMDGANRAMSNVKLEYTVKGYNGAAPTKKFVEPATMFDINKTIMRCLVKNIAMFGIGLYIYSREDLPEEPSDASVKQANALPKTTQTINDSQAKQIEDLAKKANCPITSILNGYKIDKLLDLPANKYEKTIKGLQKKLLEVKNDNS